MMMMMISSFCEVSNRETNRWTGKTRSESFITALVVVKHSEVDTCTVYDYNINLVNDTRSSQIQTDGNNVWRPGGRSTVA